MGKNEEINFVGQPVLKQVMEIAAAIDIKMNLWIFLLH